MKVLLLEDAGSVYFELLEHLSEVHFVSEVLAAYQVSEAMDKFENEEPDFMIVDLNVSSSGLKREEVDASEGGRLSGWLWLKNYVFPQSEEWRDKVIIYSEYIRILKNNVQKKEYKGLKLLTKKNYSIEDVLDVFRAMVENKHN